VTEFLLYKKGKHEKGETRETNEEQKNALVNIWSTSLWIYLFNRLLNSLLGR